MVGTRGYPEAGLIRPICEVAQHQTNNMRPSTIQASEWAQSLPAGLAWVRD